MSKVARLEPLSHRAVSDWAIWAGARAAARAKTMRWVSISRPSCAPASATRKGGATTPFRHEDAAEVTRRSAGKNPRRAAAPQSRYTRRSAHHSSLDGADRVVAARCAEGAEGERLARGGSRARAKGGCSSARLLSVARVLCVRVAACALVCDVVRCMCARLKRGCGGRMASRALTKGGWCGKSSRRRSHLERSLRLSFAQCASLWPARCQARGRVSV